MNQQTQNTQQNSQHSPHTEHARHDATGTTRAGARFGGRPLLDDNLVDALLMKSRALDSDYDERLGYLLATASSWSYADAATLQKKLAFYGMKDATVEPLSVVNEAMFVVAHAFFIRSACGRIGILSFRGTEPVNLVNWLTDAEVVWKELGHGRVHAGFFMNVEALWQDILATLGRAQSAQPANGHPAREPLRDLYVTGHSLGAAMAVIAAKRLLDDGETRFRGVYTYGQPMVGDLAFADACTVAFAGRMFRHIYGKDLVCRMPPRSVDREFVHFGAARTSGDAEKKPWMPSANQSPAAARFILPTVLTAGASFLARRMRLTRGWKLAFSLDDHVPTNYVVTSRTTLGVVAALSNGVCTRVARARVVRRASGRRPSNPALLFGPRVTGGPRGVPGSNTSFSV